MSLQQDQVLACYQAQCTLYPCPIATNPVAVCFSTSLMLGLRSFRGHQHSSMRQEDSPGSQQVQPPVAMATLNTQANVPEGALELSEALLQTIVGMFPANVHKACRSWPSLDPAVGNLKSNFTGGTDYSRTKQLCLVFSGLRNLGRLGSWCPRLQCLSLKANHLKCLRPLAPLASHLSYLDVSDNSVSTLESLSMLSSLRSLAAANNELTSFHGAPP